MLFSLGTGCSVGVYFTMIELWRKNKEGFNFESPAPITAALPEESGGHKKGLKGRDVPMMSVEGLFNHRLLLYQFDDESTSSTIVDTYLPLTTLGIQTWG